MADDLGTVTAWADTMRSAEARRDAAIVRARTKGHSLRDIAAAAGVSHQTVQNILDRLETV